jgi:hypothetical protein
MSVDKSKSQTIENWAHYFVLDKKADGGDEWFNITLTLAKQAIKKALPMEGPPPDSIRARRLKERWKDPNWAEKRKKDMSKFGKQQWKTLAPKIKEGLNNWLKNPENIASRRANMERINANPEVAKRRTDGAKKMWANPEYYERRCREISEMNRARWKDPVYRDSQIKRVKKQWADKKFIEKMASANKARWTPSEKLRMSILISKIRRTKKNASQT